MSTQWKPSVVFQLEKEPKKTLKTGSQKYNEFLYDELRKQTGLPEEINDIIYEMALTPLMAEEMKEDLSNYIYNRQRGNIYKIKPKSRNVYKLKSHAEPITADLTQSFNRLYRKTERPRYVLGEVSAIEMILNEIELEYQELLHGNLSQKTRREKYERVQQMLIRILQLLGEDDYLKSFVLFRDENRDEDAMIEQRLRRYIHIFFDTDTENYLTDKLDRTMVYNTDDYLEKVYYSS